MGFQQGLLTGEGGGKEAVALQKTKIVKDRHLYPTKTGSEIRLAVKSSSWELNTFKNRCQIQMQSSMNFFSNASLALLSRLF